MHSAMVISREILQIGKPLCILQKQRPTHRENLAAMWFLLWKALAMAAYINNVGVSAIFLKWKPCDHLTFEGDTYALRRQKYKYSYFYIFLPNISSSCRMYAYVHLNGLGPTGSFSRRSTVSPDPTHACIFPNKVADMHCSVVIADYLNQHLYNLVTCDPPFWWMLFGGFTGLKYHAPLPHHPVTSH